MASLLRFLIVDDNRDDALMLTWMIEEQHARSVRCEVATSRREALEWLDPSKHEPFDAILLDLNLTDSQGLETFRPIRAAASRATPIVIFSGRDDERDLRDLLLQEGAESYFVKGNLTAADIFEALRDAVTRSRNAGRVSQQEAQILEDARTKNDRMIESLRRVCADEDPLYLLGDAMHAIYRMMVAGHQRSMVLNSHMEIAIGKLQQVDRTAITASNRALSAQDATEVLAQRDTQFDGEINQLTERLAATEKVAKRTKRRLQMIIAAAAVAGMGAGSQTGNVIELLKYIFAGG